MDVKNELRIMIKYLLGPEEGEEVDVVENYVDTFYLIFEGYKKQLTINKLIDNWTKAMEQSRKVVETSENHSQVRLHQGKFYAYRNCIKELKQELNQH